MNPSPSPKIQAAHVETLDFLAGYARGEQYQHVLDILESLRSQVDGSVVLVPREEIERMRHLVTQLYLGEDPNNDSDEQMIEAHGLIDRWLSDTAEAGKENG